MGWWQTYDGTIIGDDLADIVDHWLDELMGRLLTEYPAISKTQVLHTLSFCTGYIRHFDKDKSEEEFLDPNTPESLAVMTYKQSRDWKRRHKVPPVESIMVAPGTPLLNVKSPFE